MAKFAVILAAAGRSWVARLGDAGGGAAEEPVGRALDAAAVGLQRRDGDFAVGVGHRADANQIEIRRCEECAIICGGTRPGEFICCVGQACGIEVAEAGDFYGAFQTTIRIKVHLPHGSATDDADPQQVAHCRFSGLIQYTLLSLISDPNPHVLQ